MSPVKQFVATRIVPWFILLCGAFALYVGIEDIVRAAGTPRWPAVDGSIIRSTVATPSQESSSGSTKYRADVVYEYVVDGVGLTGNRITMADFQTNDHSIIQGILDRYPVGRVVAVHYRPDDPRESVLEPGLRALSFLIAGIGIPTFAIGVGLVLFSPKLFGSRAEAVHAPSELRAPR